MGRNLEMMGQSYYCRPSHLVIERVIQHFFKRPKGTTARRDSMKDDLRNSSVACTNRTKDSVVGLVVGFTYFLW